MISLTVLNRIIRSAQASTWPVPDEFPDALPQSFFP
jgi:hypothetical protein